MKIINLLPKARQQELHYDSMLHSLWLVVVLSGLSFILVFLAQLGAMFYLRYETVSIHNQVSDLQNSVNKQQNTDVKNQITAANNLISDYKNLAATAPKWSKVIEAFAPLPPPQLKINSLSIDANHKSVTIEGASATREPVIQLYNNILNDSKDFYGIDYPLENVVNATNVNFHYSFYIQDKLLQ